MVLTYGDLDWSNTLVDDDKKVSDMIVWECSGCFPEYWEWLVFKRLSATSVNRDGADDDGDGDSWFKLLERSFRWAIEFLLIADFQ